MQRLFCRVVRSLGLTTQGPPSGAEGMQAESEEVGGSDASARRSNPASTT